MRLTLFLSTILCAGAEDFTEKARQALGAGRYSEAIQFYSRAIDANPENHMVYYLRGYLYEVLGKLSLSIADLTKCLQLNPSFHKARFMRAQLYLKHGQFDEAASDFDIIIKSDKSDFTEESRVHIDTILSTKKTLRDFEYYMGKNKLTQANETSSKIVEATPYCISHRRKRAELFEKMKKQQELESELKLLTTLLPNDLELLLRVSEIFYAKGDIDESNGFLIRCLQSDPENTPCRALFKKIKALKKLYAKIESSYNKPDYATAAKFARELHESGDTPHYKFLADVYLCQIHHKLKELDKALGHCSSALEFDPGHIDALLARADIYVLREQYDDAKIDYNEILSKNPNHQEAREGLSRVENIQKNLNRPDYYKILNVTKSATTQEIEKSYRKLVKKWHPDRLQNKEDIKAANKKLEQFNSARQVLTDPEMRKRFDDGFDPLDPQDQQRGGGGHHYEDGGGSFFRFFQGGGNPFEGQGGQHFRFTFG